MSSSLVQTLDFLGWLHQIFGLSFRNNDNIREIMYSLGKWKLSMDFSWYTSWIDDQFPIVFCTSERFQELSLSTLLQSKSLSDSFIQISTKSTPLMNGIPLDHVTAFILILESQQILHLMLILALIQLLANLPEYVAKSEKLSLFKSPWQSLFSMTLTYRTLSAANLLISCLCPIAGKFLIIS